MRIRDLLAYLLLLICSVLLISALSGGAGHYSAAPFVVGIVGAALAVERIISWVWRLARTWSRQASRTDDTR